ncbi:MAG: AAA family ATPase [Candidatus Marsarchaeota archaeon]|nr:AAA family ATPase [Candidatus Marsarchaeota archaeon]MCL5102198.1 AAA family ATPase [Candidatus Marsarchaeota archaeon]
MRKARAPDKLIIGITGTPGSGKSHFAALLAKKLSSNGIKPYLFELNDIVETHRAYSSKDKFGSKIISARKFSMAVRKEIPKHGTILLIGHLLPEARVNPDICVVIRIGLGKLAKRLEGRNYPVEKIRDNLLAEAYDDIGSKMQGKCRKLYEVETAAQKSEIMSYICSIASGNGKAAPKNVNIEKFMEIAKLARKGNRYGL